MSEENNNEMINTQEQQPAIESVPYEAVPYADYNSGEPGTPVKKKHKGLKIALIVIAAVIVILVVTFAIVYTTNKEYVQNKWALITKSDEEYFKWVVDKKTQNTKSAMLLKLDEAENKKFPDTLTSSGSVKFSLSSELGQMILGKSFTGIENAGFEYDLALENNTAGMLVTPFYKDVDIISLGGAVDLSNKNAYLTIPSYKSDIISLEKLIEANKDKIEELKKKFEDLNINSDSLAEVFQKYREYVSGEQLDKLVNVILERTSDVELTKGSNVHVGKLEGEFNVITGKITKTDVQNILKDYAGKFTDAFYGSIKDMASDPSLGDISTESIDSIKKNLDQAIEKLAATVDVKAFVDNKGNIAGGSLKITVGRYPVAISWLTLPDENDDTKSVFAADIQFEGLVIATITNDMVRTDTLVSNNITIKPGAFVASAAEAVAPGIGNYSLSIISKATKKSSDTEDCEFSISVLNKTDALALLEVNCSVTYGKADMPIDIKSGKIIDLYDVPDSDYIDVTLFGKQLFNKLDEINDQGLNNFIDRALGKSGLDLKKLRDLVDSGAADVANNSLKKALRKALGLPEPYNYASIAEAPKEENGNFVYSWDILKDSDITYDALSFEVYDHFRKPEIVEPDVETEKKTLLLQYADQTYAYDAEPGSGIEMGDKIVFDAVPLMFGVPMESYAYAGNTATIGKYEYGAGIDDKLLGVQAGQTKDIDLTLDERYGDFAGYSGTFRITVTKIQKTFGPEWSERFIVGELGYESLEACEAYLEEEAKKKLPEPEPDISVFDIESAFIDELIYQNTYASPDEETKGIIDAYYGSIASKGTYFLQDLYGANNAQRNQDEKNRIVGPSSDYKLNRTMFFAKVAYDMNLAVVPDRLSALYDTLAKELNYASGQELQDKIKMYYGERFMVDYAIERIICDVLYEKYQKQKEFGLLNLES